MASYTPTSGSEPEEVLCKMELVYFTNEFPKEDLVDVFRRLHNHSKDRSHSLLAQFINEATLAVKDEVRKLPTETKRQFPPFSTLFSWAEDAELREGLMCGAVEGVLLIVAQLATYIGYHEQNPEEHHNFARKSLAALGVGLLSATAVARSSCLAELPLTGADAVRLAFRMGIHVQNVSENLEARDLSETPETWAYVVPNVDPTAAQKELDAIHSSEDMPESGKIFVSAVSRTSVTISGPPFKLKSIFNKSEFFRETRAIALPVYGGLCHAPHVYSLEDVHSIIEPGVLTGLDTRPAMPVYSSSTGVPYQVKTSAELLECAVSELLTKAICWDNVVQGIVDQAQCSLNTELVVYHFRESVPLNDLNRELKANMSHLQVSMTPLMQWMSRTAPKATTPRSTAQAKLAIVGMSCRLPGGATSTESFWNVLEQGLDVSRVIPADRFDVETHYDPTGKELNKTMTQYGCFIDEPGMFDAPFFNMSPREAQVVDPQMRLALVTAYEALERSGYVANRTAATLLSRIGTWYGQAADDYREVNQGQAVSTYYIPGGCRAFGPGRINYFFKFAGPSYSVDTACSSGLAAIEVACQALWNGEVDTAVAGGVNVLTNPDGFAGLCNGHFLTKGHNACKTWDATADGYCRADGIGSLVIKRLEDAEADNDNILGVILGSSTNHSAEAVSITHPHAGHQSFLSRQVLRQAGVDPLDVSYVELHGTGTQAGDHEEMQGILDVYAPLTKRRNKERPLHIGAVKANVGHGESVAGTTALIKVLLMLQKNAIPPHIGIKTEINPRFPKDFDKRNLHIALEETPWPQVPGKKRIAAVNNFGAAGGNTTMILEEAPVRTIVEADPRQTHIVAVSAKTKSSLTGNIERLITYLDSNPDIKIADVGYTTTARRYQHTHRLTIAAKDVGQLKQQLASQLEKVDSIKPVDKSSPPPVCFAFTGQGASYKSMNQELYRDVPTFRQHIQHLDALARRQGFPSFVPALDGSHHKDHAHPPVVAQLALVCTEIALAKYWASLGVKPDVVMGHSLGEYAAMHVAGVTTASDAIFMVGRRAQMLQEKCQIGSHTMMAVRASLSQIAESSAGMHYTVACANGPSDTVLSGTKAQMEAIAKPLEAAGYRCINLDVAFAFHSEQTDPILDDFRAIAKTGVVFQEPKLPVISPLLGKVVFDGKTLNANYVARATRESVDFLAALQNAQKISTISEETIWIEIGPHPVCTGFVKSTVPSTKVAVPSMRRGEDNWKTMAESMAALHLAGVSVDWNEFHRPFEGRLRLLDLPTYAWNEKNYWLQYEGDWALTKGNNFYTTRKDSSSGNAVPPRSVHLNSSLKTSTVQHIVEESFENGAGVVVMESDLMQPDFLAAAHGHRMNGCGVVTSSIHADIAYTLGEHLFMKLNPRAKSVHINVADLVVTKGLVANQDTSQPQLIRVTAKCENIAHQTATLSWQNVDNKGEAGEAFATATLHYGDSAEWTRSWMPMTHFVQGRIQALEQLAGEGKANRFSRKMAYLLFAKNLVDYADKYRGMQAVTIHEFEAFTDVQLSTEKSGTWTVPPYFIDSVAHLAGFVMNCSDSIDTTQNYCVTPGWQSMRFAKPLVPGARYRSYVKMLPTEQDPTVYLGDVYIMQDDAIVGVVGGIQFRRYPRILLNKFFSPPDKSAGGPKKSAPSAAPAAAPATAAPATAKPDTGDDARGKKDVLSEKPKEPTADKESKAVQPSIAAPAAAAAASSVSSIAAKAVQLIANEAGLEISELGAEASFADLGIDSLMSLVISEKFGSELDVKVAGSLFLDFPTIGDLTGWLNESHG